MNSQRKDASPSETQTAYAWRDADWLVLHQKKAVLPKRCVLCDAPAHGRARKMFLQDNSLGCALVSVLFIFGPLALVMLSFLSPRAKVKLWLCAEHKARERFWWRLVLGTVLLGIAMPALGIFCPVGWSDTWAYTPIVGGLILLVVAMGMAAMHPQPIRAKKIAKPFVWLDKVHPDYLARFPEVPPQQPSSTVLSVAVEAERDRSASSA